MGFFLDPFASYLDQPAILDARRAGGLTGSTGQAAIEVLLRARADSLSFQHLFDQINPATRAIQFIAQELIGGAGGGAKTAMNTTAQDAVSVLALQGGQEFWR